VVAGRFVVEDSQLVSPEVDDRLARHRSAAARLQSLEG
jgi:hypothetical protein